MTPKVRTILSEVLAADYAQVRINERNLANFRKDRINSKIREREIFRPCHCHPFNALNINQRNIL